MKRKRPKLSEYQWSQVFGIRCKSKRGQLLSAAEKELVEAAFAEDPERYGAMSSKVFEETLPFGARGVSR